MTDMRKTNGMKMERTIDKTKYVVRIYFNPDAKEDAGTKMKRLIQQEIRSSYLATA